MRRCVMVVRRQAVGICKVRIRQPELSRLVVHLLNERIVSAALARDRDRGVVAGGQHQAVQRITQGERLPLLQVHGRALDLRILRLDRIGPVEVALAQRDQRRHDLGGRGHGQALIRVVRKQHLACVCVHHHRAARAERTGYRHAQHRQQQRAYYLFHRLHLSPHNKTYSAACE